MPASNASLYVKGRVITDRPRCGWVEFCPHQTLQLIYLIHKLGSVQCCKEKVIRKAYIINRGPPLLKCCKILTLLHSDVQPYIVCF